MDESLEKAIGVANFMATLTSQKKIALEEYKQSIIYYNNGASFTATPTLISFVGTLVSLGHESIVLLDDNNIPTSIDDLESFLKTISRIYAEAANKYAVVYNNLKSKRKVEDIVKLWAKVYYFLPLTIQMLTM